MAREGNAAGHVLAGIDHEQLAGDGAAGGEEPEHGLRAADTGGDPYPSWPRTCAASVPAERGGPARVPPPSTTSVCPVM